MIDSAKAATGGQMQVPRMRYFSGPPLAKTHFTPVYGEMHLIPVFLASSPVLSRCFTCEICKERSTTESY